MYSQESSLKVVGRSLRGIFCVVQRFYNHRTNSLALLNSANVVLIPKKEGAESIGDYRLISLIHGIAKLISKLLAARLQPYMNAIVSTNQSAFIKSRAIHEVIMYCPRLDEGTLIG